MQTKLERAMTRMGPTPAAFAQLWQKFGMFAGLAYGWRVVN